MGVKLYSIEFCLDFYLLSQARLITDIGSPSLKAESSTFFKSWNTNEAWLVFF